MKALLSICIVFSGSLAIGQSNLDWSLQNQIKLFNCENDSNKVEVLQNAARFYLGIDSLKTAQEYLIESYSIKSERHVLKSILKIHSLKKESTLNQQIHTLLLNTNTNSLDDEALTLSAIFYMQNQMLDAADIYIKRLEEKQLVTSDFLSDSSDIKYKSVKKAKRLNMVIPGLGVSYAGKPHIGTLNLLFVTGAGYFTYYQFTKENYLTAALTGVGIFSRFYLGGISYAESLALKSNKNQMAKYCREKIEMLKKGLLN